MEFEFTALAKPYFARLLALPVPEFGVDQAYDIYMQSGSLRFLLFFIHAHDIYPNIYTFTCT